MANQGTFSEPYLVPKIWVCLLCAPTEDLLRHPDATCQPEQSNEQLLGLLVHG